MPQDLVSKPPAILFVGQEPSGAQLPSSPALAALAFLPVLPQARRTPVEQATPDLVLVLYGEGAVVVRGGRQDRRALRPFSSAGFQRRRQYCRLARRSAVILLSSVIWSALSEVKLFGLRRFDAAGRLRHRHSAHQWVGSSVRATRTSVAIQLSCWT